MKSNLANYMTRLMSLWLLSALPIMCFGVNANLAPNLAEVAQYTIEEFDQLFDSVSQEEFLSSIDKDQIEREIDRRFFDALLSNVQINPLLYRDGEVNDHGQLVPCFYHNTEDSKLHYAYEWYRESYEKKQIEDYIAETGSYPANGSIKKLTNDEIDQIYSKKNQSSKDLVATYLKQKSHGSLLVADFIRSFKLYPTSTRGKEVFGHYSYDVVFEQVRKTNTFKELEKLNSEAISSYKHYIDNELIKNYQKLLEELETFKNNYFLPVEQALKDYKVSASNLELSHVKINFKGLFKKLNQDIKLSFHSSSYLKVKLNKVFSDEPQEFKKRFSDESLAFTLDKNLAIQSKDAEQDLKKQLKDHESALSESQKSQIKGLVFNLQKQRFDYVSYPDDPNRMLLSTLIDSASLLDGSSSTTPPVQPNQPPVQNNQQGALPHTLVMVRKYELADGSYVRPVVHGLEVANAAEVDVASLIGGGYELAGVQGGSSDLLRLSYKTYNPINNHTSSPRHAVVDQSNLSSHTFEKVVTLPMIKGKYKVRVEVNHTTLGAAVAEPSAVSGFEDTPVVLVTIELLRIV